MSRRTERDAIVVGAGPNGLAAAVALAREGLDVLLVEGAAEPGGGARTAELTLPGFRHDVCSAVHPLAAVSPFLASLPLHEHGLEWIETPLACAHPLTDRPAALLTRDPRSTAAGLGDDGPAWADLVDPLLERWHDLLPELLGPLHWPRHPRAMARFGMLGLRSATGLVRRFRDEGARALWAGLCAHSFLPLERSPSAAVGLALALVGHASGWPIARGGSGRITEALAAHLVTLGGEIRTGLRVSRLEELPTARALLLDVTPWQLLSIAREKLPARYARRLARYRYGPAAFKLDYALAEPVPWTDPMCARASTVHLGGTLEEVAAAERACARGEMPARPFVLFSQPTTFDAERAPTGGHVGWAYAHVPHGWPGDATDAVEAQIERFAPGFKDLILHRIARGPRALERDNPNLVGGGHQRRRPGPSPALRQTDGPTRPLRDPGRGALPLFFLHSTRWRGAWNVRVARGTVRAPKDIRAADHPSNWLPASFVWDIDVHLKPQGTTPFGLHLHAAQRIQVWHERCARV